MKRKIFKIIFFNCLFFLIFLVIADYILSRIYINKQIDCHYVLCEISFNDEHTLFGQKYILNYKKDKFGLRGNYSKVEDINIIVIGGSTVDERYVSLNDTWTYKLESKLKKINSNIVVVNSGVDGQSTYGHLWNFTNWYNFITNLNPKIYIMYFGGNDLIPRINNKLFDNVDYESNFLKVFKKILINNSFFINTVRKIIGIAFAKLWGFSNESIYDANHTYSQHTTLNNEFFTFYYKDYLKKIIEPRLKKILKITNSRNAKLILVPQKIARWKINNTNQVLGSNSSFSSDNKEPSYIFNLNNKEYKINNADLGLMNIFFNDFVMKFCKDEKIYCYNGINININDKNTYDLLHTNIKGNEEISNKLYYFLKDHDLIKDIK